MKRIGKKRLAVDIPTGIHDTIRDITKKRCIKITTFVIRALIREIQEEKKYERSD